MARTLSAPCLAMRPRRTVQHRRLVVIGVIAMGAACQSDRAATEPSEFPVQFVVSNHLVAPISISVDGIPYVGLQGGVSTAITVSSSAQWLTWMSAKPTDSRGQQIPDDIGEVQILVAGINRVLDVSNVINDQTYITAGIFNNTNAPVSIGVYDGSSVSCASELSAASDVSGFTRIGYYRLLPATEVRAYRGSRCSGPHVSWPSSQLRDFREKSGLLTLSLDSAP